MAKVVEETFETEVRRKVTRTAFKIEEVSTEHASLSKSKWLMNYDPCLISRIICV